MFFKFFIYSMIIPLLLDKTYNNNKMLLQILIFLITLVSFHHSTEGFHHHQQQHHHHQQQQQQPQQQIKLEANYELIENDSRYISYQGKFNKFHSNITLYTQRKTRLLLKENF